MEGSQAIRRAPTARGIRLILPMCSIGEGDRYCWDSGNKFPVLPHPGLWPPSPYCGAGAFRSACWNEHLTAAFGRALSATQRGLSGRSARLLFGVRCRMRRAANSRGGCSASAVDVGSDPGSVAGVSVARDGDAVSRGLFLLRFEAGDRLAAPHAARRVTSGGDFAFGDVAITGRR